MVTTSKNKAVNGNKKSSKTDDKTDFASQLRASCISVAVNELIRRENCNGGRLPHLAMEEIVNGLRKQGIVVDRNHLNYKKRLVRLSQIPALDVVVVNSDVNAEASYLSSGVTTACSLLNNTEEVSHFSSAGLASVANSTNIVNSTGTSTGTSTEQEQSLHTASTSSGQTRRGRPVGSSNDAKSKRCERRAACIIDITKSYSAELDRVRGINNTSNKKQRTSRGFLEGIIKQKWQEYDLCNYNGTKLMVPSETIRNRVNTCMNPLAKHRGTDSPLAPMEDVIVDICIQMGKIRQPLTVGETIDLTNSIMKGSEYQSILSNFKGKHNPDLPLELNNEVGKGWWTGFIRRHGHKLVTKRGERFANDRASWSKITYMRQMYNVIYDNMVEAKIARTLDLPVSMDALGNVVNDTSPDVLGLPCDIEIEHPAFLLFGDETGCDTSQKKDGHVGGRKFVVQRGTVPKEMSSTKDKHFTVVGLTAANGEPVLCIIIFSGSEKEDLPHYWATGIDILVEPVHDEEGNIILDDCNFGEGKYFPSGPTCHFQGKSIPYLPLVSPSGGISGKLLVEILKWLDRYEVFERKEGGPVPFLVVDGHESRLDPVFLSYINNEEHKWYVSLGVPYATSYWQVGDSSEQNGAFKMALANAKRKLTSYKSDRGMPIAISYEDIIPLVNEAWPLSFGRITTNRKAVADRGWYPPNRNLLLHPEIEHDDDEQEADDENTGSTNDDNNNETTTNNLHASSLNLNDGKAGSCLEKILQYRSRHGGIEKQRQNLDQGKSIIEEIAKGRRLTSGLLVSRGEHSLNNQSVLACLKEKTKREERQVRKAQVKARKELRERISYIVNLRLTKPDMSKWSGKECSTYLQYKKQRGDLKMPKGVSQLRSRCFEFNHRPSPICSTHPSDDDDSDCSSTSIVGADEDGSIVGANELALFENNDAVVNDEGIIVDNNAENDRSHEV